MTFIFTSKTNIIDMIFSQLIGVKIQKKTCIAKYSQNQQTDWTGKSHKSHFLLQQISLYKFYVSEIFLKQLSENYERIIYEGDQF